jgi:hypothetical protein
VTLREAFDQQTALRRLIPLPGDLLAVANSFLLSGMAWMLSRSSEERRPRLSSFRINGAVRYGILPVVICMAKRATLLGC